MIDRKGRMIRRGAALIAALILTGCSSGTDATAALQIPSQPPPPPNVQQVPPQQHSVPRLTPSPGSPMLPPPANGDVSGGGPGDAAAVARLAAQLPTLNATAYDYSDGIPGYDVVKRVIGLTPAAPVLNQIDPFVSCAVSKGAVAFRGFGLKAAATSRIPYDALGGVLVLSENRATSIDVLLGCIGTSGGGTSLQPCFDAYRYRWTADGTNETYDAIVFSTQRRMCTDIQQWYAGRGVPVYRHFA